MSLRGIVAFLLSCVTLLGVTSANETPKPKFDIAGPSVIVNVVRNGETLPATMVPYLVPGDAIDISFPKDVQFSSSPRWHLVVADMYEDAAQHAPTFPIRDADLSAARAGAQWSIAYDGKATPVIFLIPEDGSRYGHGIPDARAAIADSANRALLLRTATITANAEAKASTLESFLGSLSSVEPGQLTDGRSRVAAASQSLFGYDLGDQACFDVSVAQSTQYACAAQAITTGYESTPKMNVVAAVGSELSVNTATYGMLIGALYQLLARRRVVAHYIFVPGAIKPGSSSTTIFMDQEPAYDATAAKPSTIVYFEVGSRGTSPAAAVYGPAPSLASCLNGTTLDVAMPFNGLPIYFRSHRMLIRTPSQTYDLPATYDALRGYSASLTGDEVAALSGGGSVTISSLWGFDSLDAPPVNVVKAHSARWEIEQKPGTVNVVSGEKASSLTISDGDAGMGTCVRSVAVTDSVGRTIPVANLQRTSDGVVATLDSSAAIGPAGSAVINEADKIVSAPLPFSIFPALPSITKAIAYLPKGTLVLEGSGLKYINTVTLEHTGITFGTGSPNTDGSWTFTTQKPASYDPAWLHETMAISFTMLPPDPRTNAVEADVVYAPPSTTR
jgi:hypothetical protein